MGHKGLVAVCLSLAVVFFSYPATAEDSVDAWSSDRGVEYSARRNGTVVGRARAGRGPVTRWEPGRDGETIRYSEETRTWHYIGGQRGIAIRELPPSPDAVLYVVTRPDGSIDLVWRVPPNGGSPALQAQVQQVVNGLVPVSATPLSVSPGERGLTGFETYFWVNASSEFADGETTEVLQILGQSVTISIQLTDARWTWGDGLTFDGTDLGTAPPGRSNARHTYQRSGTMSVRADFEFSARYRIGGGPWFELAPILRSGSLSYPVVQSRGQLTQP